MNKRDVKGTILILLIVIYVITYRNLLVTDLANFSYAISSAFILFMTFLAYLFFGYKQFKFNSIRKRVCTLLFVVIVVYFALIYTIGIFTGFTRNQFDLSFIGIINNIIGLLLFIIATELFRYIFISGNSDKKYLTVFLTLVIALMDFNIVFDAMALTDAESIFFLVTTSIVPIFVKNILLSYLTYNLGHTPSMVYHISMCVYPFIIPVLPNISNYFISILGIVVPFIIYLFTSRMLTEYYDKSSPEFNHRIFNIFDIPIFICVAIFVLLISGIFRFYLIGVASGSMSPSINKGDAIMIDQSYTIDQLKIGDIIAYQNGERVIIHRIVSIKTNEEGKKVVDTKGDANNTNDYVELTDDEVIGKYLFRIPFIAWPTVWLRERMN